MLQEGVQNHLMSGGWVQKMHYKKFGKGSDEQIILTKQILVQKYPKFIYGMAHFEFGLNLQKQGFEQEGFIAIWLNLI